MCAEHGLPQLKAMSLNFLQDITKLRKLLYAKQNYKPNVTNLTVDEKTRVKITKEERPINLRGQEWPGI